MKLADQETILHSMKPEPKLIVLWFFSRCIKHGFYSAFFPVFGLLFYFNSNTPKTFNPLDDFHFWVSIGSFLFSLGCLTSYVYHRYLISTIHYLITDRRCIWIGGILRRVEHSVSYHKITDVERAQNIVEQFLSISTINLFTPGTASLRSGVGTQPVPELRFEGLASSVEPTESINEYIRKFGISQP